MGPPCFITIHEVARGCGFSAAYLPSSAMQLATEPPATQPYALLSGFWECEVGGAVSSQSGGERLWAPLPAYTRWRGNVELAPPNSQPQSSQPPTLLCSFQGLGM